VHKERHLANQLCLLLLAQGDYLDVAPIDVGQIWALSMFWKHLQFSNIFSNTFLNGVSIILEYL
jgi:hypothetical protein